MENKTKTTDSKIFENVRKNCICQNFYTRVHNEVQFEAEAKKTSVKNQNG